MHRNRRSPITDGLACAALFILASGDAAAQTVTMISVFPTAVPISPSAVFLVSFVLAATGYWALRRRLPKSIKQVRGLPLMAIICAASLVTMTSGDWIERAYAAVCSQCNFTLTGNPSTFGPVAWDEDITVTNGTGPFNTASVSVNCPSYAPCDLVTPHGVPSPPQCRAGLLLNKGDACLLRVETHAGQSLLSGGANMYVVADATSGILSATTPNPGPALEQFLIETSPGGAIFLRSVGNGKYFSVHTGDSVVYADVADPNTATQWVVFVVDGTAPQQIVILQNGPVGSNVNVLQFDPPSKHLMVVSLPTLSALSDPNSQFYLSN
jgi:hypothetical protein